jgi:dihydrofolate synthase/folylpolyglutamate synthase
MSESVRLSYKETTDWLFSQLPMYQRVGQAAYRKDLHNIKVLAEHLDHPEHQFKSIHVGGTNGKGSCSHMLAAVFQEAGYKVGLYTSPHLKDFRERIRINGQMISKEKVVDFVVHHKPFFETHKLSFFEMTVGLAFEVFAKEKVDIAIVEVGMGGRLDATNIIKPELSVITNIGFDHMQFLGDTRPKIAREKAGIIKRHTPVVIGEIHTETKPVFEEIARDLSAPIVFAEEDHYQLYDCELKGLYQIKNQKTVLQGLKILKEGGWEISEEHLESGLSKVVKNTGLKGRWQILNDSPQTIADTAHNLEGLTYVAMQLSTMRYDKLHVVMGFVNDKDVNAMVNLLPKQANYYFSAPDIPRAMPVENLKDKLKKLDIQSRYFSTLKEAFNQANSEAKPKDLIFVGGSIFTVAELLPDE